jgi:hypothetical protein
LATDYAQLTGNLLRFYDFTNKVVLFVGAGGRQLLALSAGTKKLIAIDQDVEASPLRPLVPHRAKASSRHVVDVKHLFTDS